MRLFTCSAILSLAVLALLNSGCSSNSTESQVGQTVVRPGVGSTFNFRDWHVDESGATISDSTTKYTVLDTAAVLGDHAHLVSMTSPQLDTLLFTYASHGIQIYRPRIDIFQGVALPEEWITIDTTDPTTHVLYNQFDTVNYAGTKLYFLSHADVAPMSDTVVVVSGKSYTAFRWKTTSTVTVTVAINGSVTTTTVESVRSFAPAIGSVVSDVTVVSGATAQSPIPNGTETLMLTSFNIR